MLAHPLRAAAASGVFDEIHVSTDDLDIAKVAAAEGFPPRFARDDALADDFSPVRAVVHDVMSVFSANGQHFDSVALVYATAALLEADDLARAYPVFLEQPMRPLLSVVETGTPAEKMLRLEEGVLRPVFSNAFSERTQDVSATYRDAGAFCFFSAETLKQESCCLKPLEFRPFVLEPWKGLDIDTETDLRFAEIIKAGLQAPQCTGCDG
jgi:N-acylneuraminate cytidylyltransferase